MEMGKIESACLSTYLASFSQTMRSVGGGGVHNMIEKSSRKPYQ